MPTCVLVSAAVIKLTVRKAALKRGIKTAYQLARRYEIVSGVDPDPRFEQLFRRLWKGEASPRMESLDMAAEALDCELSELLVRVPNKRSKNHNGTH